MLDKLRISQRESWKKQKGWRKPLAFHPISYIIRRIEKKIWVTAMCQVEASHGIIRLKGTLEIFYSNSLTKTGIPFHPRGKAVQHLLKNFQWWSTFTGDKLIWTFITPVVRKFFLILSLDLLGKAFTYWVLSYLQVPWRINTHPE